MRVAVCISGICKTSNPLGDLKKNNRIQKEKFPNADFYYATWEGYRDEFYGSFPDETNVHFFPEPEMHYHPYLDIDPTNFVSQFYPDVINWMKKGGKQRLGWSQHHTKQILIHTWLLDKIKKDYDVIVRTRFDGFISKKANFSTYLEDTIANNRANCFSATKKDKFNELTQFDSSPGKKHSKWMCDQLFIHPPNAIDVNHVMQLHNEKKLHAAETGWYQVVSMPHGSNHRDFDGWVNHDKNVLDVHLKEKR